MNLKYILGKDGKLVFMRIEKHSKKFHVSQRGAATGGVIVTIALLINPKQFGAKSIRFTNKIH